MGDELVLALLLAAFAAVGPLLAGGIIGLDALLLGWRKTFKRLRSHPKLVSFIGLSTPLFVAALLSPALIFSTDVLPVMAVLGVFVSPLVALWPLMKAVRCAGQSLRDHKQQRTVRRLEEPETRDAEIHRLRTRVIAEKGNVGYAEALLRAAETLARASCWEELHALAKTADLHRLNATGDGLVCVFGALACLHLADVEAARAWLAGVDGELPGEHETWRLTLDAVVAAVSGDTRRAEQLVERIDTRKNYDMEASVTKAHVLAARGNADAARELLLRVRVEHDDEELEALDIVSGPATPLAKELKRGPGSPFR